MRQRITKHFKNKDITSLIDFSFNIKVLLCDLYIFCVLFGGMDGKQHINYLCELCDSVADIFWGGSCVLVFPKDFIKNILTKGKISIIELKRRRSENESTVISFWLPKKIFSQFYPRCLY